jgi:hypothetical protein
MSDPDNETTKTSGADEFTPAPPPVQMTEEEAGITPDDESTDAQAGDGTIAVSQDTANRALEAVQILVENNRSASQQLESLMTIVLDAAEVANRSASHVTTTGGQLNKAAEKLIDGAQKTATQSKVILALVAAVLVGCAGTFSFIAVQLQGKVEQLDEMMLAVGKRAVDLKRRMESMDDINTQLTELNLKQESTQSVQQAIEDKMATIIDIAKGVPKKTPEPAGKPVAAAPEPVAPKQAEKVEKPEQAAKKNEASSADAAKKIEAAKAKAEAAKAEAARAEAANKALLQQLSGLDALLKEQSKSVKDLSGQVNNLQGSVSNVEAIKKDVEGLAKLQQQQERARALEAEKAAQEQAAANARRDKELKDKERELARERDRLRERDAARDRELAKEREAARERELAKEREAARERELAKEREKDTKPKERSVAYNREQSRPSGNTGTDVPAYSKPSVAKPE